jgi:hypothetical protein
MQCELSDHSNSEVGKTNEALDDVDKSGKSAFNLSFIEQHER